MTAVVGPNGSGKSNIADAVRWVMGEQSTKNLRGEKMEDVIFLGTHNRKATGFALVALTIDNADRQLDFDADEVTISRKLLRTGDSEYRINKTAVRLRDINEILMDTGLGKDGYSMIGQGKIEEIVSAKSTQRREIFEEAAGISKYRYHKEEAEKRLENAYENLLRLKDIITELEGRVSPLKEQASKAEIFLTLANEKKALEVSLWVDTINRSREMMSEQEEQIIIAKNKSGDIKAILDELQCKLEEDFAKAQKYSIDIDFKRKLISDMKTELGQCDSDIAVFNNDVAHNSETMQELQTDILKFTQNKDATLKNISDNNKSISDKENSEKFMNDEKNQLEQKKSELSGKLDILLMSLSELKAKRAACEQNISLEKLNKVSSSALIEETSQRLKLLEISGTNREDNLHSQEKEIAHCTELVKNIDRHILSLENTKNGFIIKAENCEKRINTLNLEQSNLLAEKNKKLQKTKILSDMEQNLDGYYDSVKHIMKASNRNQLSGIHGPVSQLISATSNYSLAIETALGAAMQNIAVTDEKAAKEAINYLKFSKLGRATFLPISVINQQTFQAPDNIKSKKGYVGWAADLVSYNNKYKKIVCNLLGKVAVAEDLDCAVEIAKSYNYKFRIVTLDGQTVNAGGSMTGGSNVKNAGFLSRKSEIDTLAKEAEELENRLLEMFPKINESKEEFSALTASMSGLDGEIKTALEDKITFNSELKRLSLNYEDALKAKAEVLHEHEQIKHKLESLQNSNLCANDKIAIITNNLEETCVKIEQAKNNADELSQRVQTIAEGINNKRFELLAVAKDIEALKNTIAQLNNLHSEQKQEVTLLMGRIQALQESTMNFEAAIQQKLDRKKALMEDVSREQNAIELALQKRALLEQKLNETRISEKEYISKKERISAEIGRIEDKKNMLQTEYDKIIAKLWDEYSLTRSQADEIAVPVNDSENMRLHVAEIKNKIKNLGNVNLSAIEEYREVNERYIFMNKQAKDIEHSRIELIRLIRELTSQMRELFLDNFKKINENFKSVFEELFMGGYGELVLTDPENILESGIEINVQPPGKIIKNISSLSGGEKSFVAIAIYFAILKVKPSPFCILDEIEAALDEVNVTRYARYLKKLSDKTQFIAITHRRGTMEEADVMYGVTMQEKGVSKLLELDITQVESKLGIK